MLYSDLTPINSLVVSCQTTTHIHKNSVTENFCESIPLFFAFRFACISRCDFYCLISIECDSMVGFLRLSHLLYNPICSQKLSAFEFFFIRVDLRFLAYQFLGFCSRLTQLLLLRLTAISIPITIQSLITYTKFNFRLFEKTLHII